MRLASCSPLIRSLFCLTGLTCGVAADAVAQQDLTLVDAVTRALAKNRDIAIERETVQQAEFSIDRARGAYEPLFRAEGRYRDQRVPVTSIFSGAPEGELAPTFREISSSASYSQLLASGASVTFSTSVARDSTQQLPDAHLTGLVHLVRRRDPPAAAAESPVSIPPGAPSASRSSRATAARRRCAGPSPKPPPPSNRRTGPSSPPIRTSKSVAPASISRSASGTTCRRGSRAR